MTKQKNILTSYYDSMLESQVIGGLDVVKNYLNEQIKNAVCNLPNCEKGNVPFNYDPFTLNQGEHDLTFGKRIIEEPEYTQKAESRVYILEATSGHIKNLLKKSSSDYAGEIEQNLNLETLSSVSIMDIGGGTGGLLFEICELLVKKHPKLNIECTVFDNSPAMVDSAKKTFNNPLKNIQANFVLYEIDKPIKKEYECDVVISNTMLHHLEFPKESIISMSKYAKKLLIVRDLSRPPMLLFNSVLEEQGKHYDGEMKELFANSLISSLSYPEFCSMAKELNAQVKTIEPMYQVLILSKR